jgi:hypothetical protein
MAQPKRILYRGVPMIEGWPEKIMAAQEIVSFKSEGRDINSDMRFMQSVFRGTDGKVHAGAFAFV